MNAFVKSTFHISQKDVHLRLLILQQLVFSKFFTLSYFLIGRATEETCWGRFKSDPAAAGSYKNKNPGEFLIIISNSNIQQLLLQDRNKQCFIVICYASWTLNYLSTLGPYKIRLAGEKS